MASPVRLFLIASIVLSVTAIGANARPGVHFHPCNTLFISYTISSDNSPQFQNPNDLNPSAFFTIFRIVREFNPKPIDFIGHDDRPDVPLPIQYSHSDDDVVKTEIVRPSNPLASFGISSLRDRSKDIVSVVVSLLFGVGCGALTSATMYLAWSLVTNRFDFDNCEWEDEDVDDSEYFSDNDVKKVGYVKIPDDPIAVPAKEVV